MNIQFEDDVKITCTDGIPETFTYSLDVLLKCKCDYFESLKTTDKKIDAIDIHLKPLYFRIIMEYLINNVSFHCADPEISNEILKTAKYLGASEYIRNFSTSVADLYILSDEDKQMRLEETQTRLFLKSLTDEKELMIKDKKGIRKLNEKEKKMFDDMDNNIIIKLENRKCEEKKSKIYTDDNGYDYYDIHPGYINMVWSEPRGICHHKSKNMTCEIGCVFGSRFCQNHFNLHTKEVRYSDDMKFNIINDYYVFGKFDPIKINNDMTEFYYNIWLDQFPMGKFVVAGGAIFCFITDTPINDVDLFLLTRNKEEAISEIYRLYTFLKEYAGMFIIATENCISFITREFKIQVILRLYYNITQIISGFDIDSCCCAFDGKHFYGMPRFMRSLKCGYNVVDPERQSKNYDERLLKYYMRGIGIALPGYDPKRVNPSVIDNKSKVEGMSKILQKVYRFVRGFNIYGFCNAYFSDYEGSLSKVKRGYQLAMLIGGLLLKEVKKNGPTKELKIPFMYSIDLDDIKNGINKNFDNISINTSPTIKPFQFITEDPGTQIGGSFHPINEDWYRSIYSPNFSLDTKAGFFDIS